jgi:hypothetical protein
LIFFAYTVVVVGLLTLGAMNFTNKKVPTIVLTTPTAQAIKKFFMFEFFLDTNIYKTLWGEGL